MRKRQLCVIIPTFNSAKTLEECLSSIFKQRVKPFEVIVVDGGSQDTTREIASSFPDIVLIKNEVSYYPGSSRNLGAEKARGDTVLFLDADCIADRQLLAFHINAYSKKDKLDGVQGIIRSKTHDKMSRTIESQFLTQFWIDNLNRDGTIKFFSAAVSNLSLDRNFFLEHRFSEDLLSCDDIELFIKLRRKKAKVLFEPRAVVYHQHPKTLQELFPQRKWYGEGFVELMGKYLNVRFRKNSIFDTSMRYLRFSDNDLVRMVYEDHREICSDCSLGVCKINHSKLPVKSRFDDKYLRQITCLGFAAGVLKKRTGQDYNWVI